MHRQRYVSLPLHEFAPETMRRWLLGFALLCACSSGEPAADGALDPGSGGGEPNVGSGGASGGSRASGGSSSSASGGSGAATGGSASVEPFVGPARIVCVGDSVTEQELSWIHPFQTELTAAGCGNFELIGYDGSPYNGAYTAPSGLQKKRIAAGGFSSRGILNWIQSKEGDLGGTPHLWIQLLGINNEYGGFLDGTYNPDVRDNPEGALKEDTKAFVELVRSKNPRARIILVKVPNHMLPDMETAVDELVTSLSTEESPVVAVDSVQGVTTVDNTHPDGPGAEKLAKPIAQEAVVAMRAWGACD